jgi:formamidopyrimidine-DNA glycosylase
MPELPEVDLVKRHLGRILPGRTIRSAELRREKLVPDMDADAFAKRLEGSRIGSVTRRGKHILFELDRGDTLITHLRMSGRFMLLDAAAEDPKFAHAIFYFDDGRLVFEDQRHFGLMKIVKTAELHEAKELKKLAPEPFGDEFSIEYLSAKLKTSGRTLKEFLLDQTKVTGLGNIYAAEALFRSRLHPEKRSNTVSKKKAELLHAAIREVLQDSINLSESVPLEPTNIGGNFYGEGASGEWSVYGREGEPCVKCKTPIERIKQAGRSTFFCRKCQR